MEFYDKDGEKIDLEISSNITEKEILKINEIPESSVVKSGVSFNCRHNYNKGFVVAVLWTICENFQF